MEVVHAVQLLVGVDRICMTRPRPRRLLPTAAKNFRHRQRRNLCGVTRPFRQVDVFGADPLLGNPVAVVLDGDGLDDDAMQRFARWTNLSETTFVLPPSNPDADYRVRIFTPAAELPFAGHPTLGTCHAWLEHGGRPRGDAIVQECAAGLIPIRSTDDRLAFAAPPLVRSGPVDAELVARLAAILRIDPDEIVDSQWVDNGPGWVAVLLSDAQAVLDLAPGMLGDLDVGVVGPHPAGHDAQFEVRAFFTVDGTTREDPVTGSLNASLAGWLLESGRATAPYIAAQGTALGRHGRVHISVDDAGAIWVAGATRTAIAGTVDF
jgi:PhzF family phenazine biosynthesis protein